MLSTGVCQELMEDWQSLWHLLHVDSPTGHEHGFPYTVICVSVHILA
jgi:hypothetical protein